MVAANWFGDGLLICVCFNGLFLWSPVYQAKKDIIDNICGTVCQQLNKLKVKVDAVIPKYKEYLL
jgi:hypothetical protein